MQLLYNYFTVFEIHGINALMIILSMYFSRFDNPWIAAEKDIIVLFLMN